MGKKGSNQKVPNLGTGYRASVTLREQSTGKKETNVNAKTRLKLEHMKNLSMWVSCEASISPLGAFFGHRLAASNEALGIPPDQSLFTCQRCESILQPGSNCTVRIEKNKARARRRCKKSNLSSQNNVVYKCHFCSHPNVVRGTPRGHMKEICPPKAKAHVKSDPAKIAVQKPAEDNTMAEFASKEISRDDSIKNSLATPLARTGTSLLEGKVRKRNRAGSKKAVESGGGSATVGAENTVGTSSKRRRKSWTGLKEIVESNAHDSSRNLTNLAIPFFL